MLCFEIFLILFFKIWFDFYPSFDLYFLIILN
jgi:hypothetical protein